MEQKAHRGFSLIELLVVIGIIGILASVILPALSVAREKAKVAKAQVMVRQIRGAVVMLQSDTGEWPGHKTEDQVESGTSGNEIFDLTTDEAGLVSTDGLYDGWNGPYISSIPLDPWDNPYFFDTDYDVDETPDEVWAAVIGSFGPNGEGENVYDDDNVYDLLVQED